MTTVIFSGFCHAGEIAISNFKSEGVTGWSEKSFKGNTTYRPVLDNGNTVLRAFSNASASALVREIKFNPQEYRYLKWSWKINRTISGGDERSKSGDDYAARVYVIFSGRFLWQTKAVNYIWANRLPKGESLPNAYTSNAGMIAVQSGNSLSGSWVSESRDILADYRKLFGTDPDNASAVAIMTDTDNTASSAEAWYGEIKLSTEP